MTFEYKSTTITELSSIAFDDGNWYFHVDASSVPQDVKDTCSQTTGSERTVDISGTTYYFFDCLKASFDAEWTYDKVTQGQMISIAEHFDPQPTV